MYLHTIRARTRHAIPYGSVQSHTYPTQQRILKNSWILCLLFPGTSKSINSCLTPVFALDGLEVVTAEGLPANAAGEHPIAGAGAPLQASRRRCSTRIVCRAHVLCAVVGLEGSLRVWCLPAYMQSGLLVFMLANGESSHCACFSYISSQCFVME